MFVKMLHTYYDESKPFEDFGIIENSSISPDKVVDMDLGKRIVGAQMLYPLFDDPKNVVYKLTKPYDDTFKNLLRKAIVDSYNQLARPWVDPTLGREDYYEINTVYITHRPKAEIYNVVVTIAMRIFDGRVVSLDADSSDSVSVIPEYSPYYNINVILSSMKKYMDNKTYTPIMDALKRQAEYKA